MRKFLTMCLLALPIVAATGQQAAAWKTFNFSISCAKGGNKFYWDSGEPPCTSCCNHFGCPAVAPVLPPVVASAGVPPIAVAPAGYQVAPAAHYGYSGYYGYDIYNWS